MRELGDQNALFIVLAVMLFVFLCAAILIIIDHKAKIPGHFRYDPFSISGLRREHPVTGFFILGVLLMIISSLLLILAVALIEQFRLSAKKAEPIILEEFEQQRATEKKRQFHNAPLSTG